MPNRQFINALHDVCRSGLLAKLKPRLGQVLQLLASYAMQAKDHKHYRTAYADHSTWARTFGVSRSTMCGYFKELERLGVIRPAEEPKHGRNNRYEIAGPKTLERIAEAMEKGRPRENGNLIPGRSVGFSEQVEVSSFPNSNVSGFPNSNGSEVSGFPNTEVVVDLQEVKEKRMSGYFPQNGRKVNGNDVHAN